MHRSQDVRQDIGSKSAFQMQGAAQHLCGNQKYVNMAVGQKRESGAR